LAALQHAAHTQVRKDISESKQQQQQQQLGDRVTSSDTADARALLSVTTAYGQQQRHSAALM